MARISPLRWIGGKSLATDCILERFPNNVNLLIEPMAGGASLSLAALATNKVKDIWLGDKDQYLVNFWRQLRDNKDQLKEYLQAWLELSIENKKDLYKRYKTHVSNSDDLSDLNVLDAAKFFFVNRSSFSGTTTRGGYSGTRFTQSSIDKLDKVAPMLSGQSIIQVDMCSPGSPVEFYCKYWEALVYVDPPYHIGKASKLYKGHEEFDHVKFSERIKALNAKVLLSYNDCDSIRELYKDWTIESYDLTYGSKNKDNVGKELLIRNY